MAVAGIGTPPSGRSPESLAEGARASDEAQLERELALVFAPLHKRCLGVAVGSVAAVLVAALTLLHVARSPDDPYPLVLLRQYFIGYSVSPIGALVGAAWGFWAGFVVGWFFAFARNLVLYVIEVTLRARAELRATRGFLDEI